MKNSSTRMLFILLLILLATGWSYCLNKIEIPVLGYHRIDNEHHDALTLSTYEFDAQMKYLKDNGYTTITPDELYDFLKYGKELPYKAVLITFDDGYENNYTNAYPILNKYDLHATIFLISHYIGLPDYLRWDEIDLMKNNINFEGHTYSHPHLNQIQDPAELKQELLDSKIDLEQHLGYPVKYLAYPYGDYNQSVIDALKSYGYLAAYTVRLGDDTVHDDLFTLNRVPVFQSYSHTFVRFWLNLHFPYIMNKLQNMSLKIHNAV